MHQISLADIITLRSIPRGIELTCDHPDLPLDDSNLAYRAAEEILKRCSAGEEWLSISRSTYPLEQDWREAAPMLRRS
jgi:4-diphosphocytidyl-2C-methyl-D-erythritol kinase